MFKRWLVLVLAMLIPAAVIATTSETAHAQLPNKKQRQEQAKAAYKSGKAKMDAGNYAAAVADFQLADTMWPGAAPKYYAAYCMDKAGQKKQAISAYRRFINSNPGAKYADRVALATQRIAALEKDLKAAAKGKIILSVNPPIQGIVLKVDGQPVAGTESEVPPGPHTVEANAPGYAPFRQQVDVVAGTQIEVRVAMQRAVTTPTRKSSKGRPLIIAGFVVGGVGVVSAAVMTAFGVMALNSSSDFDDTPTVDLADDTDRNGLIADVFLGVAIAGVGAGAVLLGIGYSKQSTGMITLSPMYAAGGGGAQLGIDF
jgi:hypothetical protein